MANEAQWAYSTQMTAISTTANVAANGFNGSAEVTSLSSTQHNNYIYADAALYCSFSTSISSASNAIILYRRDLNIDGTNDAPIPQSAAPAYRNSPAGVYTIPPFTGTSSGYFSLPEAKGVELTSNCEFYIENLTNATITACTLKITPKTLKPA